MSSKIGRGAIAVALGLMFAAAASVLSAGAAARVGMVRVGAAARLPLFSSVVPLAASTQLQLNIALAPQDPAGLAQFATAVSTPGNPDYRQYLTVAQFAQRFGATPAAVAAVSSALSSDGLTVGQPTANNLMIPVSGTAAAIDNAMSAQLSQVVLPGGRHAFANLAAPAFPSSIAPYIQGVIGLDNVTPVQSAGLVRNANARLPSVAHPARRNPHLSTNGSPSPGCSLSPGSNVPGSQNGYSYDQLAAAYGFTSLYSAGDFGQGQTVALVELQPFSTTDVATFQACYGTSAPVNQVNVGGGPSTNDNCGQGSTTCSDGESALDIETVIALAPKATIDVYEGPDTSGIAEQAPVLNQIVSDNQAKVISTSFGVCESATPGATIASENTSLQEAATQGQSFFSASGDSGSETCSQLGSSNNSFSTGLSVEDPAAQPFATGVGGTEMFTINSQQQAAYDDTGVSPSEVVWNEGTNPKCSCGGGTGPGGGGGSGGGLSTKWSMPSYQSSASSSLGVIGPNSGGSSVCGSSNCREVPDVSANADGLTGYLTFSSNGAPGSWGSVGGTSAASPLWAAFTALTNANSTCRGLTIGFANPSLYNLAGSAYSSDFRDIQATQTLASALGEPLQEVQNNDTLAEWGAQSSNSSNLYPVTAGFDMATGLGSMQAGPLASALCGARAPVYGVSVGNPGTQSSTVGKPVSLQISASDPGPGASLTLSASGLPAGLGMSSSGLVTGTPTTVAGGVVTVTASDQFGNSGSTQFAWTVAAPPPPPPPPPPPAPTTTTTTTPTPTTTTPAPVITPPTGALTLKGFTNGKLALGVRLAEGLNAPAIRAVTLSLPRGMSFAKKAKFLRKGIVVKLGKTKLAFRTSGGGGSLTLLFASPEPGVTISVGKPAVSESSSLQKSIKKHKTKQLKIGITVIDASGVPTPLSTTIKV